jgi:Delta7-sterol 5-desaturase
MYEHATLYEIAAYVVPRVLTFDFARYATAAGIVFAIVWALQRTSLRHRKIQKRTAKLSDYRREILSSLQTIMVYAVVAVGIVWCARNGYINRIQPSFGISTDLVYLAGIIFAHDAYFYWVHRAMHHPVLFKAFHQHHHRSITPTPFAAYSFAIPEAIVMALFMPFWQFFIATPGWVLFGFLCIMIVRNAMGHAGFELQPRWWLSSPLTRWINTTTHHDLHHFGGFNTNYGLYFTWWDQIMGTENHNYHATFARVVGNTVEQQPALQSSSTVVSG